MEHYDPTDRESRLGVGPTDLRTWRERFLDVLLRLVFAVGLLVAIPSVAYAIHVGEWVIAVVDAVALTVTATLAFYPRIPYPVRAIGFLAVIYLLGVFLFVVVGPVAAMYLLGVPVLAVVFRGTRTAVVALVINAATLVALGFVPGLEPAVGDESIENAGSWLVVILNFVFVNAIITAATAAIIGRLERSLAATRRLVVAVEQSPSGLLVTDADGRPVYANTTLLEHLGVEVDLLEDLTVSEIVARAAPTPTEPLPSDGWTGTLDAPLDHEGTPPRTLAMTLRLSQDPDGFDQFVLTTTDITAQHLLQERIARSEKLQALGTLVGGTAHDFNNALGSIMGLSELLRSEATDPRQAELIDDILRASDRAQGVVRQLMAFGRQPQPGAALVDVGEVLSRDLPLFRASVPARIDLVLDLDADSGVGLLTPLSGVELHQIVANLVVNAAHAVDQHPQPRIAISATRAPASDLGLPDAIRARLGSACVHLSVSDNGHGMPSEVLTQVLDPFFTTKTPDRGTGLGLSSVHGIVTAIGGHLDIESQPDRGTTVHLHLPLLAGAPAVAPDSISEPAASPSDSDLEQPADPAPAPAPIRILVVDDETMIVSSTRRLLERRGYEVLSTTEPEEAQAWVDDPSVVVDVVLSDVSMPRLSGLDLARRVRAERPSTPIVLMSGYSDSVRAEDRVDLAPLHLVDKPFTIDRLVDTLERALGSR